MKLSLLKTSLFLTGLLLTSLNFAQSSNILIMNGKLADMDENPIMNATCDLQFNIIDSEAKVLFESQYVVSTDENGRYRIIMENLPALFPESLKNDMLTLGITLKTADESKWLEGGSFLVKYHLEKTAGEEYKITRFEGQKLISIAKDSIWDFSDEYPLAYLSSRFMLSFNKEITDPDRIIQTCYELNPLDKPEVPQAPTMQRGVKGGYAIGKYKSGE